MINLYVDDLRTSPPGWQVARTVAEAKMYMLEHTIQDLSLDHDLGHAEGCPGCVAENAETPTDYVPHIDAPNGKHLVLWMIEHNIWPKNRPIVHSQNPVGKETMVGLIARYGPYEDY
jgi:hypothetical protein